MAVMLAVVVYGQSRFQNFVPYLLFVEVVGVILFLISFRSFNKNELVITGLPVCFCATIGGK